MITNYNSLQLPPLPPRNRDQLKKATQLHLKLTCENKNQGLVVQGNNPGLFIVSGVNQGFSLQPTAMLIRNILPATASFIEAKQQSACRSSSSQSTSASSFRINSKNHEIRIRKSPQHFNKNVKASKQSIETHNNSKTARSHSTNTNSNNQHKLATSTEQKAKPRIPQKVDIIVQKPRKYTKPLEKFIYDNIMLRHNVPGMNVVFAHKGKILYDQAFGLANIEQKRPASNKNYHRIASVSKAITRSCLDILKERGLLRFNQKVFPELLTQFDCSANSMLNLVTVQHLIEHEVGIWGTVGNGEDPMFWWSHKFSQAELIQKTIDSQKWHLNSDPGKKFCYSNFGYCLLGRIIEKVCKTSFLDFVRKEFQVDVKLAGSTYDQLLDNENTYYSAFPEEAYGMHLARMDSCAGLIINPRQLVKFADQVDDCFSQRGSIAGAESLLSKWGDWTMAAFCNRRKAYQTPLALTDLFDKLCKEFNQESIDYGDEEERSEESIWD